MRPLCVSEDILPLGEFKSKASQVLKNIAVSGHTLVITQNGRPAAVVMAPIEYDRIQERRRFLESVAAGLADAEAGRLMTTEDVVERLDLVPEGDG